jgi:hypothetical protein
MDTYRINANELWYYILYPSITIFLIGAAALTVYQIIYFLQYFNPSFVVNPIFLYLLCIPLTAIILIGVLCYAAIPKFRSKVNTVVDESIHKTTTNDGLILFIQSLPIALGSIGLAIIVYYIVTLFNKIPTPASGYYEQFKDTPSLGSILKNVQTETDKLRSSLDTLQTATDDTCSVVKGIEQKFIDNETSPSGEGDPPSKEEAARIKAQKMPSATKKWNQKKQDWADTHGQIPVVECFESESLSDLVDANQQLNDLLASAPVQRVVAQVKRLNTSNSFAQKYMNDLANELEKQKEGFDNPTPIPTSEDTITTSNKLIQSSRSIRSTIQGILDTTKTIKQQYTALNTKANDPNTVNNLAENR